MLSVPGISHAVMAEYQGRVESDRQAGLRVIAELRAENARLRDQLAAQQRVIEQMGERLTICSGLLSKAAERKAA